MQASLLIRTSAVEKASVLFLSYLLRVLFHSLHNYLPSNLYWTDWNREAPKIETSTVSGANRRVLVNTDIGLPNGLTFDPFSKLLCWADAGNCTKDGPKDSTKWEKQLRLYPIGTRAPLHPLPLSWLERL